ncbi:hypothetical protein, partial [Clostridium sp.]|uniref:hypothetical protein n=1 Tax=Clostridium sp. TaxID=1506 RepID=UPI002847AE8F
MSGFTNNNIIDKVGGSTAVLIHSAELLANAATDSNTPNEIVKRDINGNFNANIITANLNGNSTTATTAVNFTGNLVGEVSGSQIATVMDNASVIAKVLTGFLANAGIVVSTDTILQAINKIVGNVNNLTTIIGTPTDSNTPNEIVKRDINGNFNANIITANLTGTASDVLNASVIAKVLTGYTAGSGIITASDTIISAFNKISGNLTNATADTAITSKLLTGFVSSSGIITASDTILTAIQKLNGNIASAGTITLTGDCSGSSNSNTVSTLRGGTVSIPTGSDTVATLTALQTLTNKNITGTTNTVEATKMRNGSTWSVSFGGAAPTTGQLLGYNGSNTTTWVSSDNTATSNTIVLRTSAGGIACVN